ncbi:replication factor-A protein 1 domain protein [Trichuris suis]|nr:replication factor-A protein 1 domain protein [Trichuris suis]
MADLEHALTVGGVKTMLDGQQNQPVIVQIIQLKRIPDQSPEHCRYRVQISDGQQSCGSNVCYPWYRLVRLSACMLATQRNELVDTGMLDPLAIVRVNRFITNNISGKQFIVLVDLDVLKRGSAVGRLIGETNFAKESSRLPPTFLSDAPERTEEQAQDRPNSDALVQPPPFAPGELRAGSGRGSVNQDRVYLIQGGTIKVANRQFTSIDNDYELTFSPETQVEPCFDENICDLPEVSFHLTKIKEIGEISRDRLIDVLGVVVTIGPIESKIARSTLKELKKRDVLLVDDSGVSITLSLWEAEAENFNCEVNSLLAVKGCRISEFGGMVNTLFSVN